jgi:hypothetical protein
MNRGILATTLALGLASALWLPTLHLFFAKNQDAAFADTGTPVRARALAAGLLDANANEDPMGRLHFASGEWDFMGRSYLVWALANMALREPSKQAEYLAAIDRTIEETLRLERENGFMYFLLPYARAKPFVQRPARSLFVDGEIALMFGLRRLVEEREDDKRALASRVAAISERMSAGPVASAESYPDECWTFCNAVALAALSVADALDGTDHTPLERRWVDVAKAKLIDAKTGLLVSRYALDGRVMEGPEGSSIWMVTHALQIVDEPFARDQYERAARALGRSVLGFGYAVEWPAEAPGHADIDSGPIVPVLGASAGSSGLALVGAKSFGDRDYFKKLVTTLDFAAFPIERAQPSAEVGNGAKSAELSYAASNGVGDAVLLYATVLGPAWAKVKELRRR